MTRADADSWDVASSVGATATMVAAARAIASESRTRSSTILSPSRLRAVGMDFFNRLLDGEFVSSDGDEDATRLMTNVMAVHPVLRRFLLRDPTASSRR